MGSYEFHPARVGVHCRTIKTDPTRWLSAMLSNDVYGFADVYRFYFLRLQEEIVARNTGKSKPVGNVKPGQWTEFVEISLAGVDWADVVTLYGTGDALFNALQELVVNGYRVSLSHNTQTDAVIASVTCRDEDSPNAGKTFNAFAATWTEAVMAALYKHFVVSEGVWVRPGGGSTRPLFG